MMKKFLASMLMMASITAASEAAPKSLDITPVQKEQKVTRVPLTPVASQNFLKPAKPANEVLGAKYNVIDKMYFYSNNAGCDDGTNNPFVYEPKSGFLFTIARGYYSTDGEPSGRIGWMYSTDMGASWTSPVTIYAGDNTPPVYPSLGVLNPTGSKNLTDMKFVVTANIIDYSTGSYKNKGLSYWFINDMSNAVNVTPFEFLGPETNNTGSLLQWYRTGMLPYQASPTTHEFYTWGGLSPANGSSAVLGSYGVSRSELTEEIIDPNIVPTQWNASNFKAAPNPQQSYYNSGMMMDYDAQGNLYSVVANLFVDDPDNRVIAVSKSTDKGATWTTFDRCPVSLLNNYIVSKGADLSLETGFNPWLFPYDASGFAVTGTDEFSYFAKILYYLPDDDDEDTYNEAMMEYVEIYKKAGTWGIRKVADCGGSVRNFTLGAVVEDGPSETPIYGFNDRGNELQLAKSADGQYLICKFVDVLGYIVTPEITYNQRNTQTQDDEYDVQTFTDTTMMMTDIFLGYRKIGETEWTVKNASNDEDFYNKSTFIPAIVPSINQIPVFSLITDTVRSVYAAYYAMPTVAQQMITDWEQILAYTLFDMDNLPTGVKEDKENSDLSISSITPNPATSMATINFNVEAPGVATVKVFNVMGQEVASLFNSYVGNGAFTTSFDATKVNEGTYYVTLVINGKSTTKVLNVVK